MEKETFQHYIVKRYEPAINWYDTKSIWNQHFYRILQWSLIVLSTITPVIIAGQAKYPIIPAWVPLLTSTIVAVISSGLKAFKYEEHWLNYRTTCETLKKERHFFNAELEDYKTAEDKEALFVERVEALISRENTLWLSTSRRHEGD